MQTFECHYRRGKWPTRRYFSHVKEVFTAAGSMLGKFHDCTPPPCQIPAAPPFTPGECAKYSYITLFFFFFDVYDA